MRQWIKYLIALVALIFLTFIIKTSSERNTYHTYFLNRDSLVAAINIDRSIFSSKGFPIGFQYNLLKEYASVQNCKINITTTDFESDYWQMMLDKEVDIIVLENSDTIPDAYLHKIARSIPMNDYSWAVRLSDVELLDNINIWLSYYMQKKEYRHLVNRFFRSYNINTHIDNMTQTNFLSPYDDIIKRQSKVIGWDWRLLAAIIYQESHFSMNAHSGKGATGLMQVLPSTAEHYGVSDIYNPAENVKAGVLHLRHLKRIYETEGMDSANVVKFTLAAYNAGEGRIEDCINFAIANHKDYREWEEVSRTIPMMKLPENYANADYLRYGRFNGNQTIKYVDDVLSKYEDYRFVIMP